VEDTTGRIFVAEPAHKIAIMAGAHNGPQLHSPRDVTLKRVETTCVWVGLQHDVVTFVSQCIHCGITKPFREPRPLGESIRSSHPNQILGMDYDTFGDHKILVLRDEFSGFVNLGITDSADSAFVTECLFAWMSRFGVPSTVASDNGSHFKNEIVRDLATKYGINLHYFPPYAAWTNPVERTNEVLKTALHRLSSEMGVPLLPNLRPLVQLVEFGINHSATKALAGHAPLKVFMGREPWNRVAVTLRRSDTAPHHVREFNLANLKHLLDEEDALRDEVNKKVAETRHQRHLVNARQRDRDPRSKPADFEIGDFVLLARAVLPSKTLSRWIGPYRVIGTRSPWVFLVESLIDEPPIRVEAHAQRLRRFAGKDLLLTENILSQARLYADQPYEFERFRDLRLVTTQDGRPEYQLLTEWVGFEPERATWEPLSNFLPSSPGAVLAFVADENLVPPASRPLLARLRTELERDAQLARAGATPTA